MDCRRETPSDIAAIRSVVAAAFPGPAEADLVDALREAGDAVISVVAVGDGAIVGHAMLSTMAAPFRALGLAPLAVVPERQRRGIGSTLVRYALGLARSEGWSAVFVLGEPRLYGRFGFSAPRARGFASRYAGPHFMVVCLDAGLTVSTGPVDYAPAFAALG